MQHKLQTEGFGLRLRPVRVEDAAFIVWLRNLDHAKGRVGDSATSIASQEAWVKQYFERADDYYFIIETMSACRPIGTYGLWAFVGASAESGRWIVRPGVPAAIPSAILGIDLGFGALGLKEIRVKTVSTNLHVLSLNRKFGMRETGILKADQVIGGKPVDQLSFVLMPDDWAKARQRLLPLANIAEPEIREWDRAQDQNAEFPPNDSV
jgi:RimJ/RimL family protein N-acetyltransferase